MVPHRRQQTGEDRDALIDAGELRVDVAQRVPPAELPDVHARAAAGGLHGKAVIVAPGA
ncbi:hypothetical protein ACLVWQ_13625 [Streptomyces sp. CWNU-52B]|uniref:hypothetical protein n=1 Tax=unclassified Streptomyces TaxID=2593676 RepID=UPI0039C2D2A1